MLKRIQIGSYKCIRNADVQVDSFNMLIGNHNSGKSSFLDALCFLKDILIYDVERAVRKRAECLRELIWQNDEDRQIEIALEAQHPESPRLHLRYEVAIGLDRQGAIGIHAENLFVLNHPPSAFKAIVHTAPPATHRTRHVIRRSLGQIALYQSERTRLSFSQRIPPLRLALSTMPEDRDRFPMSLWLKQTIAERFHFIRPNIHRPCPPDAPRTLQDDAANLPIVLQSIDPTRLRWWVAHLRVIFPELEDVRIIERMDDRALYLAAIFQNGVVAPAWQLSDGMLRLFAMTVLPYLAQKGEVFFIDSPENGIHPLAIEGMCQSLRSIYDGQTFVVTYSPAVLSTASPSELLIFSKAQDGSSQIVRGTDSSIVLEDPSLIENYLYIS